MKRGSWRNWEVSLRGPIQQKVENYYFMLAYAFGVIAFGRNNLSQQEDIFFTFLLFMQVQKTIVFLLILPRAHFLEEHLNPLASLAQLVQDLVQHKQHPVVVCLELEHLRLASHRYNVFLHISLFDSHLTSIAWKPCLASAYLFFAL